MSYKRCDKSAFGVIIEKKVEFTLITAKMKLLLTLLFALVAAAVAARHEEESADELLDSLIERHFEAESDVLNRATEKAALPPPHPADVPADDKQFDSSSAMSNSMSLSPLTGQMAAGTGGAMSQITPFGNNMMTMTGSMAGGPTGSAMGFGGSASIMGHQFSFGNANTGGKKRDVGQSPSEALEQRIDGLKKKIEQLTRNLEADMERR